MQTRFVKLSVLIVWKFFVMSTQQHSFKNVKHQRTNITVVKSVKQFIALDGESINDKYVLLGTSHPSYCLENRSGITTDEAFHFLFSLGNNRHLRKQKSVFVGYFFGYD